MYDYIYHMDKLILVTGPCEFLVMYDLQIHMVCHKMVTGPCEFLVMYDLFCTV